MKPLAILIDDNKEICELFSLLKPQYCDTIAVQNFNKLLKVLDNSWEKCRYISLILVDENYEELTIESLVTKNSRQEGQFLLDFATAVTLFQIPRPLCFPLHRGRQIITNSQTWIKPIWVRLENFLKSLKKKNKYKTLYETAYKEWENLPIADLNNSKAELDFVSFADKMTSIWQEIAREFFDEINKEKVIEILPKSKIILSDTNDNIDVEPNEFSCLLLLFLSEEFKKNRELFPLCPDVNEEEEKKFTEISEPLINVISKFPSFSNIDDKEKLYWKLYNSIKKIPENINNKKWKKIINISQNDWKTENAYISLKYKEYIPKIDSQNCWDKWREVKEWKEITKIFLTYWQEKIFNKYGLKVDPWLPSFIRDIRK